MTGIFIAGILWGTIGIFVKELNALGADVSLIGFMRMFFAFMFSLITALFIHGRKIIIRDKRTILLCALLGIICNGLFNIFYTNSIKLNGMGVACVLMYTAPVFTAIASGLIFHEKFSRIKIFALIMNIIGCILTVTGINIFQSDNISVIGILYGLGSGFGYGMAAVIGRSAGEKTDALIMSMYSFFFASLFMIIFTKPDIIPAFINLRIMITGMLYGLIPTTLAYLVYYNGLKAINDTSRVPVIASVEPVTAVIAGMLLYNEQIDAANFAGVAIVLVSIIIMMKAE
ncbi:MAG: EamA family transporter [Synergistaceae bacterium]|nr:EamA family transporter [Synergistaceae bacterium]MBQ3448986.1 EamA family transporter [Synergistaceae bacterium]MBQ3694528.1 EamA family transporter [Synergistaceae bacterium]MBQ9629295.1 EamA family transporter [Synergistaceae bacterium]MBR0068865.1 EamA family transporter [Synergistaceae bacterium]